MDNADHHVNQVDQMLPFGSPEENVREARERHLRQYLEAQRLKMKAKEEELRPIRLSRMRRRTYLGGALLSEGIAALCLWSAWPEDNFRDTDLDSKWFLLFILVLIVANWFSGCIQQSTAWPPGRRISEARRRQKEAWEPMKVRGHHYGYRFASSVAVVAMLSNMFISADTYELPEVLKSPKALSFAFATFAVILGTIPVAFVGWFGPDEMPIKEGPVATRPESV